MIDALYNYSLLVACITLFTFGISMLLAKTPKKSIYFSYDRSRRILGVALIFFGIQVLLQLIFGFRTSFPYIAIALNITIFYLEAILFGMAFISLLTPEYISKHQIFRDMGKWAVCMLLLWCATLCLDGTLRTAIQIATAAFFFWQACLIILQFFTVYRQATYKVDNYYAENVNVFVRWLYKSTWGIIAFGLSGAVLAFTPKWCVAIQMFAGIFMFSYIYMSFMNYALNYGSMKVAMAETMEEEIAETKNGLDIESNVLPFNNCEQKQNDRYVQQIAELLDKWVAEGGFRENGITIDRVATTILSNRTYLSNYINSRFKCTFRSWINYHRIEYAKQLLKNSPEKSIEQIAIESGFSSGNSFGKVFNESEKMPPSKWRKEAK